MKSHRRYVRRVRNAVVLALCVSLSASAGALAAPALDRPTQQPPPMIGDTPADFAQSKGTAKSTYPPNGFTGGDSPADRPSASRAPVDTPPATIQVVRPERTIVRDVNDALPTALASLALLIALGGAGFALIRTRSLQRGVAGRSH